MKEGILRHLIKILSDIPASRGAWVHRSEQKLNAQLRAEQLEFSLVRIGKKNRPQPGEGRRQVKTLLAFFLLGMTSIHAQEYLGQLSGNLNTPDSPPNAFGIYGSPYSPVSINNPFGQYGSATGSKSAHDPYALEAPSLIRREHRLI